MGYRGGDPSRHQHPEVIVMGALGEYRDDVLIDHDNLYVTVWEDDNYKEWKVIVTIGVWSVVWSLHRGVY